MIFNRCDTIRDRCQASKSCTHAFRRQASGCGAVANEIRALILIQAYIFLRIGMYAGSTKVSHMWYSIELAQEPILLILPGNFVLSYRKLLL